MTGTLSLAFPGSRKLAAWWRQLAPYCPQTVWFGHLLLHHVEALVRLSRPCRLDRLALFVLKALALAESAPGTPRKLSNTSTIASTLAARCSASPCADWKPKD